LDPLPPGWRQARLPAEVQHDNGSDNHRGQADDKKD
jgi:hypothetical protein